MSDFEDFKAKALAHTVGLENNQVALHQKIAEQQAKITGLQKALGEAALREAELQTQVNVLRARLAHEIVGDLNEIDRILSTALAEE